MTIPLEKKKKATAEQKVLFPPLQPPFSPRGQWKSYLSAQLSPKPAACQVSAACAQAIGSMKSHLASFVMPSATDLAPLLTYAYIFLLFMSLLAYFTAPLSFVMPAYSIDQSSTLAVPIPDKAEKK